MAVYTDALKKLRKSRKLTQAQMGEHLGISQRMYSFYETGKYEMTVTMLLELADFFGVTTDCVLSRSDERPKP